MLVNNTFARRNWRLMWIDGGHWLLVLLLMGAILGAMGVRWARAGQAVAGPGMTLVNLSLRLWP